MSKKARARAQDPTPEEGLFLRHLRFGWWSLLVFVCLGLVLEGLHGFKAGAYLDLSNEARRLMWTLAHVHGGLIAIVHIVFAATLRSLPELAAAPIALASRCLFGATLLMPAGFFLGGVFLHDGDPGLGVLLVPPGGLLLAAGVFLTARALPSSGGRK